MGKELKITKTKQKLLTQVKIEMITKKDRVKTSDIFK